KLILAVGLTTIALSQVHADPICKNMTKSALQSCLQKGYKVTNSLSYREARKQMFSKIDNVNGAVKLVYSGAWYKTNSIPNHQIVNTEHTWPQSKFNDKKIKSDLHHLYATYSKINSKRGSFPFADIPDNTTEVWLNRNGNGIKKIPPISSRDNFSEYASNKFEPREEHKGAVARSMLYVYSIYGDSKVNNSWFKPQIATMLDWHDEYPASELEIKRTKKIEGIQGNTNPFILDSTLAFRLFSKTPKTIKPTTSLPIDSHLIEKKSTIKFATWNIEHLSHKTGSGLKPRNSEDYKALASYAKKLDADVIALQELDGIKAAKRILSPNEYDFHFSSRGAKQKVGFAIRKNIEWEAKADLKSLNVGNVRNGVVVTVNPDTNPIDVLAVHLKSFCFDKPESDGSRACNKLWKQVPIVEKWIDDHTKRSVPFVILGDFNRRLEPNDEVWREWNDGQPDNLNISLATQGQKSSCWGGKYPEYIDHIIVSDVETVYGSFDQLIYDTNEKTVLSDHCPISLQVKI
ncbi:MAG: endonuclease, partial [Colwellia sp.]